MSAQNGALVLVSGLPASGKTTLARPLAIRLGVAYIGKDVIKEALGDVLGPIDVEQSMQLGRASIAVMQALAKEAPRAVLDSHWHPAFNHELLALGRPLIEVFCACPGEVAMRRMRERVESRHHVHRDPDRLSGLSPEAVALPEIGPLGLGAVLEVDTTHPTDLEMVVTWVCAQPEWNGATH